MEAVMTKVKVALAQINAVVGDLKGNSRLLVDAARRAHAQGAQVMLAPELALTGYPPEDLLLRPAFLQACDLALQTLAEELGSFEGLTIVVGHPAHGAGQRQSNSRSLSDKRCMNAASVLSAGRVQATYCKRELPNYQVFDEQRYFLSGRDEGLGPVVFDAHGLRFGLLICEDAWFDEPARLACEAGAQVLCVLNASPFHLDKAAEREERMAARALAARSCMPISWVGKMKWSLTEPRLPSMPKARFAPEQPFLNLRCTCLTCPPEVKFKAT
jgi:NAD+ synthase (glutamine-hydrolysing)